MMELYNNRLMIRFPEMGKQLERLAQAWLATKLETMGRLSSYIDGPRLLEEFRSLAQYEEASVSFQRTLRIPNDGRDYPLPPGLGPFPVRHVDDFQGVPETWKKRGGLMLPMHANEALWINFSGSAPVALRIAAGGVCAVSGTDWTPNLVPSPQNYVVLPEQRWIDGFRVGDRAVRQFVAVPLGSGATVEGQMMKRESWGGIQLQAFPMRAERYWQDFVRVRCEAWWRELFESRRDLKSGEIRAISRPSCSCMHESSPDMGLGAGGKISQKILEDVHGIAVWDTTQTTRCYVHLCLASDWSWLTGTDAPTLPPTTNDYIEAGLPWFDYQPNSPSVPGENPFKSVIPVSDSPKFPTNVITVNEPIGAKSAGIFAHLGDAGPLAGVADRVVGLVHELSPQGQFVRVRGAASEWVLKPRSWIGVYLSKGISGHDPKIILSLDAWPVNLREVTSLPVAQGRKPQWSKITLRSASDLELAIPAIKFAAAAGSRV